VLLSRNTTGAAGPSTSVASTNRGNEHRRDVLVSLGRDPRVHEAHQLASASGISRCALRFSLTSSEAARGSLPLHAKKQCYEARTIDDEFLTRCSEALSPRVAGEMRGRSSLGLEI
jgi:hypothetical protein